MTHVADEEAAFSFSFPEAFTREAEQREMPKDDGLSFTPDRDGCYNFESLQNRGGGVDGRRAFSLFLLRIGSISDIMFTIDDEACSSSKACA